MLVDSAGQIANDSPFGLAGYVQTTNLKRARTVAAQLEVDNIWINGSSESPYRLYSVAPNKAAGAASAASMASASQPTKECICEPNVAETQDKSARPTVDFDHHSSEFAENWRSTTSDLRTKGDLSHTRPSWAIDSLTEGDLIIGKNQASQIGTLVERQTRLIRLIHLPARDADALRIAITDTMSDLPVTLIRSITWDQGIEMARHIDITDDLGAAVYFCDSRSPWQRGSNENANGLLRQYFPKGTPLNAYTAEHLRAVEHEINNRPRHVLGDRSPAELFAALLTSPDHRLLRR